MPIKCESFRPRRTATLRGFCELVLTETHLKIFDVALHEKNGKRWAALPSKPQVNREGYVLRGENNKIKYAPVMAFDSREAGDQFSRLAIAAVLERFPRVFDDDDGAGE
jgi:hypothetical protein